MLQVAPLGRALPLPPIIDAGETERAADHDLRCAAAYPTPRPRIAVEQLARRMLTNTMLATYCSIWGAVSFGLWMLGTAVALVITRLVPAWGSAPILVLGFGGLGAGLVAGYASIRKRRIEAQTIAREGQVIAGVATYGRSQDTLGGELGQMLAKPLGETRYCISFSIGFIRHEVWVALPAPPAEGEPHRVLVHPGARLAVAFDALGSGHVGELYRVETDQLGDA